MNDTIHQAINICIKKNIPFVAYILPNQSNWDFFSNPSTNINCNTKFIINTFEQHFANPLEINAELNAIETIKAAIQTVSAQRSELGAIQNRLEHTIASDNTPC